MYHHAMLHSVVSVLHTMTAVVRQTASQHCMSCALGGGGIYSFSQSTRLYRCARVVTNLINNTSTKCFSCLNSLKQISLQVVKNKCAPPYKIAEFDIMFGSGISSLGCLLDAAEGVDVVQRKGSWYSFGDQKLGQGRDKTLAILAESKDMQRYAFPRFFMQSSMSFVVAGITSLTRAFA